MLNGASFFRVLLLSETSKFLAEKLLLYLLCVYCIKAGVSCPDSNAPQTHTQVIDSVHACTTLAQSRPCPVE